jgi:hypothetical protein
MFQSWRSAQTPTQSSLNSDHKGPVSDYVDGWTVLQLCLQKQGWCGPSAESVSVNPLTVWALSGVCAGQLTL